MGYESKESGFSTQEMLLFFGCVALSLYVGRTRKLVNKQSLPQEFDEKQGLLGTGTIDLLITCCNQLLIGALNINISTNRMLVFFYFSYGVALLKACLRNAT